MSNTKHKPTLLYLAAFVILVLILVDTAIMLFVVPAFKELFNNFGAELSGSTQVVIGISDFLVRYWGLFIPASLIFVVGGVVGIATLYQQNVPIPNNMDRLITVVLILIMIFFAAPIPFSIIAMYLPIYFIGTVV
jgi:type IV pilus assembly protein PilC